MPANVELIRLVRVLKEQCGTSEILVALAEVVLEENGDAKERHQIRKEAAAIRKTANAIDNGDV